MTVVVRTDVNDRIEQVSCSASSVQLPTSNLQDPEMGLGRVELPAYGLGNRRSIHLSYSPRSQFYQS